MAVRSNDLMLFAVNLSHHRRRISAGRKLRFPKLLFCINIEGANVKVGACKR
jgi:hypothetical protein